jgi:hypothetical protein
MNPPYKEWMSALNVWNASGESYYFSCKKEIGVIISDQIPLAALLHAQVLVFHLP